MRVLLALQQGLTRRAACACANISNQTLLDWINSDSEFLEAVLRAEDTGAAELERVIRESAIGYYAETKTTATKLRWVKRTVTAPDGTVTETEEPVEYTETTTARSYQRDTRLGLEILARRNPAEWGAGLDRQVRRLSDADIIALLVGTLQQGDQQIAGNAADNIIDVADVTDATATGSVLALPAATGGAFGDAAAGAGVARDAAPDE